MEILIQGQMIELDFQLTETGFMWHIQAFNFLDCYYLPLIKRVIPTFLVGFDAGK